MDDFCGLGRWQRMIAFVACFGLGCLCFVVSFVSLPMIVLYPAKFAVPYTFGSLLCLCSMAFLKGFRAHFGHLFSKERAPFSITYLGSMFATLYFALGVCAIVISLLVPEQLSRHNTLLFSADDGFTVVSRIIYARWNIGSLCMSYKMKHAHLASS
jgi:hypothetical protein